MFPIKLKLICKQLAAFCCASCWCFRNHHSTLFLRCYLPLSPEWSTKECNLLFIFTFTCTNIYFTPKAQAYYFIIYSFFFSHNKFKMHTIYLIIHKGVLLGRRCIFLLWGKYITSVPCGWKLQYVGRALDRIDFCLVIQVRNNINFHKKRVVDVKSIL